VLKNTERWPKHVEDAPFFSGASRGRPWRTTRGRLAAEEAAGVGAAARSAPGRHARPLRLSLKWNGKCMERWPFVGTGGAGRAVARRTASTATHRYPYRLATEWGDVTGAWAPSRDLLTWPAPNQTFHPRADFQIRLMYILLFSYFKRRDQLTGVVLDSRALWYWWKEVLVELDGMKSIEVVLFWSHLVWR